MRYEAKFTPTVEDAVTGYRMLNRQGDDFLMLCVFGGITAVIVFGIAAYVLHFLALGVTGIFVGGGVVGVPWLMEWNFRRRTKKIKPEEQKFFFTEDGFEFSNSFMQSKETWDKITKASLDERGMLLYVGSQNFCFFIPAHAFVDGYFPLQELKSLLASKK
jgi:YcxB-like protein